MASPTLIKLPKPTETLSTFLPLGESYQNYTDYAKQNSEFKIWKENLFKQIKNQINQKLKEKDGNSGSKSQDDSDDENDFEDEIDDEIYVNIPQNYNFDIQCKLSILDAKTWRQNDHYKILGLDEFRWQTRPEDLKKAYRALVLKYHPDKGKYIADKANEKNAAKINLNDVFSCLTKSYEFLVKPSNRRSYDSYDPEFDDAVPGAMKQGKNCEPAAFFTTFTDVFSRNGRWSRHALPDFGDNDSDFGQVNDFYSCWYEFESWREFTYEKLEDLEKAEGRWERRDYAMQIKKENKLKRKDEIKRIRKLVDNAYNSDPRIKRFQKEELARKEAEKLKRKQERDAKKQEELRVLKEQEDAERQKREAIEAENKKIKDAEKKTKEAQKKLLKRSRQNLRKKIADICGESGALEVESELHLICSQLEAVELDEFREKVVNKADITDKFNEIKESLNAANLRQQEEKQKLADSLKKEKEWSVGDIQILVKAANIFPAGTTKRWDKLAAYINDHCDNQNAQKSGDGGQVNGAGHHRTAKDCMSAVKKLSEKAADSKSVKSSEDSFEQFLRQRKHANESKPQNGEITVNDEGGSKSGKAGKSKKGASGGSTAGSVNGGGAGAGTGAGTGSGAAGGTSTSGAGGGLTGEGNAWSAVEQKLLEQALKTFPTSLGKDRWDKIAATMPNRSKKECILRYKEIVAQIQAKKKAAAAVEGKK